MLRTLFLISQIHDPQVADDTNQISIKYPLTITICPTVDQIRIREKETTPEI